MPRSTTTKCLYARSGTRQTFIVVGTMVEDLGSLGLGMDVLMKMTGLSQEQVDAMRTSLEGAVVRTVGGKMRAWGQVIDA